MRRLAHLHAEERNDHEGGGDRDLRVKQRRTLSLSLSLSRTLSLPLSWIQCASGSRSLFLSSPFRYPFCLSLFCVPVSVSVCIGVCVSVHASTANPSTGQCGVTSSTSSRMFLSILDWTAFAIMSLSCGVTILCMHFKWYRTSDALLFFLDLRLRGG